MGIRETIKDALPGIFELGEDAVYRAYGESPVVDVPCKIFIDFDVELQPSGTDVQIWGTGTLIEALLSAEADIGIGTDVPLRGATFVYDGTTYTVQNVIKNDGLIVKMVVS